MSSGKHLLYYISLPALFIFILSCVFYYYLYNSKEIGPALYEKTESITELIHQKEITVNEVTKNNVVNEKNQSQKGN